jgi:transposase
MSRAISPNGWVLRHPEDLQWLERRRMQAAELFAQGNTKAEVAAELGVSVQTASRWQARWLRGGAAGMRTARQGKLAQLGAAQLAKIRRVLDSGAVAAGFDNDLWTSLSPARQAVHRQEGTRPPSQDRWCSKERLPRLDAVSRAQQPLRLRPLEEFSAAAGQSRAGTP